MIEGLFNARRSTRDYSQKQIPDEVLTEICRLATLAPSAINAQPWKLYAVTGDRAKEFIPLVQTGGANGWANGATAFVVIQSLPPHAIMRGERRVTNEPFIPNDIGILTAYLTLAAENKGVQSCIIGLRDEDGIADFLNQPKGTPFPLVVALGYASDDCPVTPKRRRDFDKVFSLIK